LIGARKTYQVFKTAENAKEIEKIDRNLTLLSWQGEKMTIFCGVGVENTQRKMPILLFFRVFSAFRG
jgi:hypothetical protein